MSNHKKYEDPTRTQDPRCKRLQERILERANNENLYVYADMGGVVDSHRGYGWLIYLHLQEGWADGMRCDWTFYTKYGKEDVPAEVFRKIEDYCVGRFGGTLDVESFGLEEYNDEA